jgi:hypothetical protein
VIINKMFGDALFGRENPLGKLLEVVSAKNEVVEALTVVGVVSDFRLYGEYDGLRPFVLARTTLANPDNAVVSPPDPGRPLSCRVSKGEDACQTSAVGPRLEF